MPDLDGQATLSELPIEELGGMGFALAMQMLRSRDDAADAVQDSLHQLLRKRSQFDSRRGELRAWFLKIVRNRCLDLIRTRTRRRTEPTDTADLHASRQESPDEIVEKRELLDLLKSELTSMPDEQREIILLRDFHRLSYADVADVLSIPVGTVMSRLHRARLELKRRMDSYR
jgi:RNA polymerase sigma-70 factor (ECF subfamily)